MGTLHRAIVDCEVPARQALAFLADGLRLGEWALGSMQTEPVAPGVVRGHSLFDGTATFVRPVADAANLAVVYHVGSSAEALQPRIRAEVEPLGDSRCRVRLLAERSPEMGDARWLRLVRCHEVEVLLIQARLEAH